MRLAKRTSNLFRARAADRRRGLDTSGLTGVIEVDPEARTADVAGMCTYEDLVDATLPYGLAPPGRPAAEDDHPRRRGHRARHRVDVVPQRAAARVGARDGRPHRRRRGRHRRRPTRARRPVPRLPQLVRHARLRDCGCASSSSRSKPFVALRHVRFHDLDELVGGDGRASSRRGSLDGSAVDYLDGVVFSAAESYLALGSADRRIRARQRLHRPADLLPLDPAR